MHGFMGGLFHRFGRGFRHGREPEGKQATLAQMRAGQRGTVVEIHGRHRFADRLSALGIRPGKRITKVSSMLMRGPITIQVGSSQAAIGFGMAKRIIVEPDQVTT